MILTLSLEQKYPFCFLDDTPTVGLLKHFTGKSGQPILDKTTKN